MAPMVHAPFDPSPRAVFFDLDDTLCDYASARHARLRIAFTLTDDGRTQLPGGVDLDAMIAESIDTHPHGADHFPQLFARYGVSDPAVARRAAEWYRSNRFHGLAFFPESLEILQSIRQGFSTHGRANATPIGVVTNGPTEVQRAKIELLGVRDLVDFAIISDEFGVAKPDPAIFREALRRAGVEAGQAVFVGDSAEHDMCGARAAGIPSVWLNRLNGTWTEPEWRPSREIRTLLELPGLIGIAPG